MKVIVPSRKLEFLLNHEVFPLNLTVKNAIFTTIDVHIALKIYRHDLAINQIILVDDEIQMTL